jgi:hypothetical protein
MILVAVLLPLVVAARPAAAVEHTVVQWKKTGQCEIVTTLPLWGDHWMVLGGYNSKMEAERALAKFRKTRACPAAKSAKRTEQPPEKRKAPAATKAARPMDMLW